MTAVANDHKRVTFDTGLKKGRKKVLKKLSFKGEQSKTYRVKKGTYYVKTAKSGAKMNGEYTIRYK